MPRRSGATISMRLQTVGVSIERRKVNWLSETMGHFPLCCGDSSRLASGARRGAATARNRLGNNGDKISDDLKAIQTILRRRWNLWIDHLFLPRMTAKSRGWGLQGSCLSCYRTQRAYMGGVM